MKKAVALILTFIMVFNLVVFIRSNTTYAEKLNIIWLDKEYDYIALFKEGLAQVELNGKWGIVQNPLQQQHNIELKAIPTYSKVLVNSKEISFDAYLIEGNNYFKLRDLASVMSK